MSSSERRITLGLAVMDGRKKMLDQVEIKLVLDKSSFFKATY